MIFKACQASQDGDELFFHGGIFKLGPYFSPCYGVKNFNSVVPALLKGFALGNRVPEDVPAPCRFRVDENPGNVVDIHEGIIKAELDSKAVELKVTFFPELPFPVHGEKLKNVFKSSSLPK